MPVAYFHALNPYSISWLGSTVDSTIRRALDLEDIGGERGVGGDMGGSMG